MSSFASGRGQAPAACPENRLAEKSGREARSDTVAETPERGREGYGADARALALAVVREMEHQAHGYAQTSANPRRAAQYSLDKSTVLRYFRLVNPDASSLVARKLVRDWAARGRYIFSTAEVVRGLGVSDVAARAALRRLKAKGEIATPYRGIHLLLPPEYEALGCLPAEQFVPQLMERLSVVYYAGLLTAARYHGAAHQQPQQYQVVVPKNRPSIRCGRVAVDFVARRNAAEMPTGQVNTPRGYLRVSSPEATAFDLVGYPERCGGLDNVATVLAELAEKLDAQRLAELGPLSPIPWAQRLGYLLERAGQESRADSLAAFVAVRATETASLIPGGERGDAPRNERWKLRINTDVEPDL